MWDIITWCVMCDVVYDDITHIQVAWYHAYTSVITYAWYSIYKLHLRSDIPHHTSHYYTSWLIFHIIHHYCDFTDSLRMNVRRTLWHMTHTRHESVLIALVLVFTHQHIWRRMMHRDTTTVTKCLGHGSHSIGIQTRGSSKVQGT